MRLIPSRGRRAEDPMELDGVTPGGVGLRGRKFRWSGYRGRGWERGGGRLAGGRAWAVWGWASGGGAVHVRLGWGGVG